MEGGRQGETALHRVVRLFNTIGPRQMGQYSMVASRFVMQALSGEPMTVYGDGTQRRSFTWMTNELAWSA